MAKILLSLGPPTAYDQVVKLQEEVILDMARAMRVEKLCIQERKSEAQLVIDEDMRRKGRKPRKESECTCRSAYGGQSHVALAEWSRQVRQARRCTGPQSRFHGAERSNRTAERSNRTAERSNRTAERSNRTAERSNRTAERAGVSAQLAFDPVSADGYRVRVRLATGREL